MEFFEKRNRASNERIKELFIAKPDVISILSGGVTVTKAPREVKYRTAGYLDRDEKHLATGGRVRIIAGAYAAHAFPHTFLLTNSGVPDNFPDGPTEAALNASELRELGVPSSQILSQDQSFSTAQELLALAKLVTERGWENIAIISNDYHLERVKETLIHLEALAPREPHVHSAIRNLQNKHIMFIGAEKMLSMINPHYAQLFKRVESSPLFLERIAAEKRGIQALREKRYSQYQPKSKPDSN